MSSAITGIYVTPGCTNVGQIALSVLLCNQMIQQVRQMGISLMRDIKMTYRKTGVVSECNCFGQTIKPWTLATSFCEQVLFVYVYTIIPPRLSDPCNFITVLLVTREPEQTTLLF